MLFARSREILTNEEHASAREVYDNWLLSPEFGKQNEFRIPLSFACPLGWEKNAEPQGDICATSQRLPLSDFHSKSIPTTSEGEGVVGLLQHSR